VALSSLRQYSYIRKPAATEEGEPLSPEFLATVAASGTDLDPDIRRFVREVSAAFSSHPAFSTLSHPRQREVAEAVRARWAAGGPTMARTRNLEVRTRSGTVRVRLHDPGARGPKPALIYLHGGGWTYFSIDTHDRLMREYAARADVVVLGVDYALSPEHRFPVALEQVIDVVRWAHEHAADLGIDGERIALGGDSAGGNLTVAASVSLRDAGEPQRVKAMLLNYAALDVECSSESVERFGGEGYMLGGEEMRQFWINYAGSVSRASAEPLITPLHARLTGLPATFLAIATCDILAEQNQLMAEKLLRAGVAVTSNAYTGASHSFLEAMAISALSRQALDDASRWLRAVLG
jgi:acetyl esterase